MGASPYDGRRGSDRGDHDGDYYDQGRDAGRASGASRGGYGQKGARSGGERGERKERDRRQPYYYSQQQSADSLASGLGAMNLGGANLTQNMTQTSSGPLTQASSTLSQPMSQPSNSLSALSQESFQGDDFYKSQSFVDPYM